MNSRAAIISATKNFVVATSKNPKNFNAPAISPFSANEVPMTKFVIYTIISLLQSTPTPIFEERVGEGGKEKKKKWVWNTGGHYYHYNFFQ